MNYSNLDYLSSLTSSPQFGPAALVFFTPTFQSKCTSAKKDASRVEAKRVFKHIILTFTLKKVILIVFKVCRAAAVWPRR